MGLTHWGQEAEDATGLDRAAGYSVSAKPSPVGCSPTEMSAVVFLQLNLEPQMKVLGLGPFHQPALNTFASAAVLDSTRWQDGRQQFPTHCQFHLETQQGGESLRLNLSSEKMGIASP